MKNHENEAPRTDGFRFWDDLNARERAIWRTAYRTAENDYNVRDLPTVATVAARAADLTDDERTAVLATLGVVASYGDEGVL